MRIDLDMIMSHRLKTSFFFKANIIRQRSLIYSKSVPHSPRPFLPDPS